MALKTSKNGLKLIKEFEGCVLTAYKCPAGVWTIGYGHTGGVKEGQKISKTKAEELLKLDLKVYENYVNNYVKVKLNQNQFDALVSFTYNCGPGSLKTSTLLKKLNQGDYRGAANELPRWNKANGQVLAGLTRRRKAEKELFLKFAPYKVKITATGLNVRKGPGTYYKKIDLLYRHEVHTIVDEEGSWGKLNNGGWISLNYTKKI